jgi:hypothetical protein
MSDQVNTPKPKGRPKGTGSANTKMLRVIITPRQERLLTILRTEQGLSESEHCRRAIDDYLNALIRSGDLVDPGAPKKEDKS